MIIKCFLALGLACGMIACQATSMSMDANSARDGAVDASVRPDALPLPDAAPLPDALPLPDAAPPPDAAALRDAEPTPDATPPDSGCQLGQVTSTATASNLDLFGTPAYLNGGQPFPPGTYRVRYVDGCMKYSSDQGWTVNAYAADRSCWYVVGASIAERLVVPPGTVGYAAGMGAFADFEACVAASRLVPPIEFTLTEASPIGVWLLDSPYTDNLAGMDSRNPTWAFEVVANSCPR